MRHHHSWVLLIQILGRNEAWINARTTPFFRRHAKTRITNAEKDPGTNSEMIPADGMLIYGLPMQDDGSVTFSRSNLTDTVLRMQSNHRSPREDNKEENEKEHKQLVEEEEEEHKDIHNYSTASTDELLRGLNLRTRTVCPDSLIIPSFASRPSTGTNLTVWELAEPREALEEWMYRDAETDGEVRKAEESGRSADLDPFGYVLWPGAQLISRFLSSCPLPPPLRRYHSDICRSGGSSIIR